MAENVIMLFFSFFWLFVWSAFVLFSTTHQDQSQP